MLLIIGTARLAADRVEAARVIMASMIEASRAETGCLEYSYAEDVIDRGLIHVKECWVNREALDEHFNSAHLKVWRAAWVSIGIGERKLRVYEVGEAQAV